MAADLSCRVAARMLLAGLFGVCVYRAVTQSITYDEALTWQLYILGPVKNIFQHFDANHHFLNTVLMRFSTSLFGVSEWSLRLPALGGAVLYFAAVYRLARAAFGECLSFLLAVALLSLNPFVLDFMVAARGYGLGLALWMWGLTLLVEGFSKGALSSKALAEAGAGLALSVTANLIYAPPVAALVGIGVYLLVRRRPAQVAIPESRKKKRSQPISRGVPEWAWFTAPMAGIALLYVLAAPVENIKVEQFYTGAATIAASLRSLTSVSLEHSGPLRTQPWIRAWCDAVAFGIGPLIVVAGLLVGWIRRNLPLLLAAGTASISALMVLLIHLLLQRPYPADRTGIYVLPLVAFVLVGLAHSGGEGRAPAKAASVAAYAMAWVFLLHFATEFNIRKFLVWEYDADTRTIGETIARERAQESSLVRIGGSWHLQESLAFYGYQNHWTWMELTNAKPAPGLDFYALVPWEREVVDKLRLKEIYRGPVSGSVLAGPRR